MGKTVDGIIVALVTPLTPEERLDEGAFRKLVSHVIAEGVHGLFPAGSTGEFYALTGEEKRRLVGWCVEEAAGRVTVMPNVGAVTTAESVALAREAEAMGADAVSVITPYYCQPSQAELFEHYATICRAVRIPVLAYNNPGRAGGVALTLETTLRLAHAFENFAGIKDSTGDLTETAELIRRAPPSFRVIMGRDTLIYGALAYGAAGAVAATANVAPRLTVSLYEAVRAGNFGEAKALQRRLAPLRMAFGIGTFPAMLKEALVMQGVLASAACKRPVGPLSAEERTRLRAVLEEVGVL
ncbi:MAG: 4-hydroxy-tetrahydrodipicolinate synthase [candidate division NC10 bacterium]|nr:4-hydroxy-tetrahydrodipicolinate synthase [candidate division NC10 bacterium]